MILAIDQGTTGTTCLVFDAGGALAGRAYSEFEQHFPRPGWVEHDAGEIWEVTPKMPADGSGSGSRAGSTPSSSHSSGSQARRRMSNSIVRDALVWSVA